MDFELDNSDKQDKSSDEELLRKELVPNYAVLTPSIRIRIDDVLNLLLVCTDKSMIQSFSRMGLFE